MTLGTGTWSIIPMPLNLVNFPPRSLETIYTLPAGSDATRYSLAREVQVYNTITSTWSIIYLRRRDMG